MHILMIPSWYPGPGDGPSGIFFRDQAEALSREGVIVGVIHPEARSLRSGGRGAWAENHWQIAKEQYGGVTVMRLGGWNPGTASLRARAFRVGARLLVRRYVDSYGRPDLIHAQSVLWGGVAAADAAERLGVPYVITEHSSSIQENLVTPREAQLAREAFIGASAVMAVGSSLASALEERVPGTHVRVVPGLVDIDFFGPSPFRDSNSGFTFLAVGALVPIKRHDVLIRSFAKAFSTTEGVSLHIGGGGPRLSALEAEARRAGLQDRIRFLGVLTRDQVREQMWHADAFVLSSRVETFGQALAEALATGLPVIATRCGGPEDTVTPANGLLVEEGNVAALSQAMVSLFVERSKWREQAGRIRETAGSQFGSRQVALRILACYEQVLDWGGIDHTEDR